MKFDWTRSISVGIISAVGVGIIIGYPEHIGAGIGLILGMGIATLGIDKKIYKKLKAIRK